MVERTSAPLRALILEDSPDDVELVLRELRRGGFDPVWERVETAEDFGEALQREWDVILSDFNMPRFDALGALEILQGRRNAPPLIVVSGTIGEDTAVAAIKAGAADYVMKDRPARLTASIRRELRDRAMRRIHGSEQKKADEAIRKLLSAIENTVDSIVMTDPQGRINYVNGGFQKLYGYTAQEVRGQTPRILKSGRHDEPYYRNLWRSLLSGEGFRGELVNRAKDGRLITVAMTANAIFDESGKRIGFIAVHHDETEKTRSAEALKTSETQLRALWARLQTIREEERTGIARELHDELGQALTALKMDLVAMRRRVASCDSEERDFVLRKVDSSVELIDGMVATIRRISSDLRPGVLLDLGLMAALEGLAQSFGERTGVPCRLNGDLRDVSFEGARATAIYRILQEALTNVARHAEAREVEIRVAPAGDAIDFEVRDDGKGFSLALLNEPSSLGLTGMRERASAIGGRVTFASGEGSGTTVRLRLSIPREERR